MNISKRIVVTLNPRMLIPIIFVTVTVLVFNFPGAGLCDAADLLKVTDIHVDIKMMEGTLTLVRGVSFARQFFLSPTTLGRRQNVRLPQGKGIAASWICI